MSARRLRASQQTAVVPLGAAAGELGRVAGTHAEVFGATDRDMVLYANYADRLGILTANATTPYKMAFANLKKSGPMVIELPPGPVAGGLGDFWQREGDPGMGILSITAPCAQPANLRRPDLEIHGHRNRAPEAVS